MSRPRPLFAPFPDAPIIIGKRRKPIPWRLLLVLVGSCIFVIGLSLNDTSTAPSSMATTVQMVGATTITIGVVWAIGRIVAYEVRRQRLRTPLQRSAEEAARRPYRW